jgi:O-acetyl-ADP-ribose deacetylase (regulator of RNase III)
MVTEISSDIFLAPIEVLVHQANCFHTMGSGVARAIRERYPEAYDADITQTQKGDRAKLGTCSIANIRRPDSRLRYIFNMYSQFTFGTEKRQTHYEALYRGLEFVKGKVTNTNLAIGFPWKLGCKLGGGSWRVVETMIRDVFEDSPYTVYICHKPGDI